MIKWYSSIHSLGKLLCKLLLNLNSEFVEESSTEDVESESSDSSFLHEVKEIIITNKKQNQYLEVIVKKS